MTPAELRATMHKLNMHPRTLAKLLGLGPNGERSVRRMLTGAKAVPSHAPALLQDALADRWPKHFTPERPDDPRQVMDDLAGRR